MRTQEEINIQVEKFKAEKASLPEYTAFGDNNWEMFDTAIQCITEQWSLNDVYDGEYESYTEMLLVSCTEWLDGFIDEIE